MASGRNIQGITVGIDGDTTGLSKALDSVDQTIKNTQSKLKDDEKADRLGMSLRRGRRGSG